MISIDGFRYDYFKYGKTPVLDRMRKCGVSTPYLRSVHPTNTFPNHYTQATVSHVQVTTNKSPYWYKNTSISIHVYISSHYSSTDS